MNPLPILCLLACIAVAVLGTPNTQHQHHSNSNSLSSYQNPSNWVSSDEIERLPALNELTLKELEKLSVDEGAQLLDKLYHLSQVNHVLKPNYVPEPGRIKGYIVGQSGDKIHFNLNNFVQTVSRQPKFGDEEVTIFIEGLPQSSNDVNKATRKLVQAYTQRYNLQAPSDPSDRDSDESGSAENQKRKNGNDNDDDSSSTTTGNLVVINLGDCIENFEQYATLNVERVGNIIGERLVQLTNEVDVPQEIIHLVGQGLGAHIAGVAGRQFTRQTGHKLRRITGLDPAKIYAKAENSLNGLARGDADFVDAIHTSAYGVGTPERVGDIDFYPNGPDTGVPGADNVIEASLRATRYFAESVRPGNERNFPAVGATSYKEYKQNKGYGKRTYMGIAASYDVEGDYVLQVNGKSPFGRNTPAQLQTGYHAAHVAWRMKEQQRRF